MYQVMPLLSTFPMACSWTVKAHCKEALQAHQELLVLQHVLVHLLVHALVLPLVLALVYLLALLPLARHPHCCPSQIPDHSPKSPSS